MVGGAGGMQKGWLTRRMVNTLQETRRCGHDRCVWCCRRVAEEGLIGGWARAKVRGVLVMSVGTVRVQLVD